MFLNNVADKLVFKFLKNINNGYLELTTHDGKLLKFGNSNEKLHANILIKLVSVILRLPHLTE